MKRFLLTLLAAAVIGLGAGAAAGTGAATAQEKAGPRSGPSTAIQDVIRSQLKAFLSDDGAGAYRHASPMIQMMFQNPGRFMQMVQKAYRPVYRARNIEFRKMGTVAGRIVQEMHLTGPDGQRYAAYYFMQKQKDGSWKINGVRLKKLPGSV